MNVQTIFDAVRKDKKLAGKNVVFLSVHGSRAYATATEGSDYDIKGIYLASAKEMFGLNPLGPESPSINGKAKAGQTDADFEVHEIGKFFKLLTKSNPNMLEYIFASEYVSWLSEGDLLAIKNLANGCVSKLVYKSYIGMYVKNMPDYYKARWKGSCPDFDWKSYGKERQVADAKALLVMLRSILSCYQVLLNGFVEIDMRKTSKFAGKTALFNHLVGVKRGDASLDLEMAFSGIEELKGMVDSAYDASALPEKVPEDVIGEIDDYLMDIRTRTVCR